MHRRHCLAWAAAPAILALPAVARAEPGVSDREVVIGQSIALQGGTLAYGVEAQAGIQAVLQPLNDSGGVHGRRLALRTLDDRNDARQAEAHAAQLADDGVFMLFGSIEGGPSAAVAKVDSDLNVEELPEEDASPTDGEPEDGQAASDDSGTEVDNA